MMFLSMLVSTTAISTASACEPGKVTGGGQCITKDSTEIPSASFGFNAMKYGDDELKGELNYVDHTTGMHVHIHEITYLVVSEPSLTRNKPWPMSKAVFGGPCTVNGEEGFWADVIVWDNGEPGTSDKFEIYVSTDTLYHGGSQIVPILAGNIQIHKPPK